MMTLGNACTIHVDVRAFCRHCDHFVLLDLAAMPTRLDPVLLLHLPLRCTACGKRGHTVTVSGRYHRD